MLDVHPVGGRLGPDGSFEIPIRLSAPIRQEACRIAEATSADARASGHKLVSICGRLVRQDETSIRSGLAAQFRLFSRLECVAYVLLTAAECSPSDNLNDGRCTPR
jgi:hypothetical protein